MRFPFKGLITLIALLALLIPLIPTISAQEIEYDITYTDDLGDISPSGGGSQIGNIDILKVSSTLETTILTQKEQIILEMQVKKEIVTDNETSYYIQIESDEEFYVFVYVAGVCVELYSEQVFIATGAGTDTLRIMVPLEDIHTPETYYNISSFAVYSSGLISYTDKCPEDTWMFAPGGPAEKPLEITEPTHGATVYGMAHVMGRTHNTLDYKDISYVEVQVDDTDEDGWITATSHDGYITWSYDWDTTEYTDDTHSVYARAFNETNKFTTIAEYWVDQATATSPKTLDMLEVRVGDKYWYEGEGEMEYLGEDVTITSRVNITQWGVGTLKANGIVYDTLIQWTEGVAELELGGFKIVLFTEGYTYYDQHTMSVLRMEQWVNYTLPFSPPTSSYSVITYDPPMNGMDFPLVVGDKWVCETTMRTVIESGGDRSDDTTDLDAEFECLRTQEVTVPAGTFDTFVKRAENTSGGGEDIGSYSGTDTSALTEGWSISYYSREAGWAVKDETYDVDGGIMNTLELVDYQRGSGTHVAVLNISAGPDLAVGEETWISATVKNTGGQHAQGVTVYFYDSEVNLHTEVIDLGPQETMTINISWTPSTDGKHVIMVSTPDHFKKRQLDVEEEENGGVKNSYIFIIIGAVVALLIIIMIAIIVVKKRREDEAEEVKVLEVVDKALDEKPKRKGGKKNSKKKKKADDD